MKIVPYTQIWVVNIQPIALHYSATTNGIAKETEAIETDLHEDEN